jgi:hypothetical protein
MESMSLQGERGVLDARNGYNLLILLNIKLSETNERKEPPHLSAHAGDIVWLFQTPVKATPHQQRHTQHQRNKSAHAVPAVVMPEHTAERPGDTGSQIIAEQVQG